MSTIDKNTEEDFLKTYILPNRRERLLFELHGKHRQSGIM